MMKMEIDRVTELDHKIYLLERKKKAMANDIKNDMVEVASYMKPSNMIQRVISDFQKKPTMKKSLMLGLSSILSGYISKKVLINGRSSLKSRILIAGLQLVTAQFVARKV